MCVEASDIAILGQNGNFCHIFALEKYFVFHTTQAGHSRNMITAIVRNKANFVQKCYISSEGTHIIILHKRPL